MHPISEKNKYIGLVFLHISKEYYALGRNKIKDISIKHAKELAKHSHLLSHVVCNGLDARYDQVTVIEADSLEEIHNAIVDFKMGEKGQYIEVIDTVVGLKAPSKKKG